MVVNLRKIAIEGEELGKYKKLIFDEMSDTPSVRSGAAAILRRLTVRSLANEARNSVYLKGFPDQSTFSRDILA
jgi:hypothetical protein